MHINRTRSLIYKVCFTDYHHISSISMLSIQLTAHSPQTNVHFLTGRFGLIISSYSNIFFLEMNYKRVAYIAYLHISVFNKIAYQRRVVVLKTMKHWIPVRLLLLLLCNELNVTRERLCMHHASYIKKENNRLEKLVRTYQMGFKYLMPLCLHTCSKKVVLSFVFSTSSSKTLFY